jgi:hypothetical protein
MEQIATQSYLEDRLSSDLEKTIKAKGQTWLKS